MSELYYLIKHNIFNVHIFKVKFSQISLDILKNWYKIELALRDVEC